MKKYYMIKTMQNVFFKLLFCTLLFTSLGKVIAQTTMLSYVIAEDPVILQIGTLRRVPLR